MNGMVPAGEKENLGGVNGKCARLVRTEKN
jgi:hypothetical protein